MTKKNIKPQQAAPIQREINTISNVGNDGGITPHRHDHNAFQNYYQPFAGDDAE